MQRASRKAQRAFRYFWREVACDHRRIVPVLSMAIVKAPFSDDKPRARPKDAPEVEHMWLSEIDFDGPLISGVLENKPNWIKSVKAGDNVQVQPNEMSDWMYVLDDEVYGGFTVNLMRSRMKPREWREHDNAWGLNFGDPLRIRLVSGSGADFRTFARNSAAVLKQALAEAPRLAQGKDGRGFTLPHLEALAGIGPTVKVLLEAGANPATKTKHGMTARQLAETLGWKNVLKVIESA